MIESNKPNRKIMKTLSLRTFISKKAIHLAALFLLLAANRSIGAAWQGCDDFSSGISWANWPTQTMSQGQLAVVGANGHVSFLLPISTPAEQNAHIIWHGTPTAAEDWMVQIKGHNSVHQPTTGYGNLQFAVLDTSSLSSVPRGYRVARRRGDDDSVNVVQWLSSGGGPTRTTVPCTTVDLLLRLVYHSASQQIEAWYDPTASGLGWTRLDTISLAEFSSSMTASSTFTFAILCNTEGYSPIPEGEIWADDFCATSTPPPLLVASAQRSAGSQVLHLTWTNNGSMCLLENAAALTGGWNTVSTPWITNAGWVSTFVTNSSLTQFYRLRAN